MPESCVLSAESHLDRVLAPRSILAAQGDDVFMAQGVCILSKQIGSNRLNCSKPMAERDMGLDGPPRVLTRIQGGWEG